MSDKTINYSGENIDVQWVGRLCIHVGECGRAKGELFVGGRKPWCQPDVANNEEVADVMMRCPTGALTWHPKDGSQTESASPENTIHATPNGPLYVRGDLDIEGAPDAAPGLKFRAALCRCGQSKNKPFCDNSHIDAGFKDSGAVGDRGKDLAESGGQLSIKPMQDGPLFIKGNASITAGTGRVAWQGTQTALCRCGASSNKPFCDGSHKNVGFQSR